jgi:glycerophosphoryl diester phosphodiesterase
MRTARLCGPNGALLIALVACRAASPVAADGGRQELADLADFTVHPQTLSLTVGDTAPVTALIRGEPATAGHAHVIWSTTDSTVLRVSRDGLLTAGSPGQAMVRADILDRAATALVTVRRLPLPDLLVVAHRGYAAVFPENTLSAVVGAFDLGADAVEVDVHLSADGVPVVIHDETVDRTTDGTGTVRNLTYEQLRALDACSKFARQWDRCAIPSVAEVLTEVAYRHGRVLLDMKGPWPQRSLQQMVSDIRRLGVTGAVTVIAFDKNLLAYVRSLDPTLSLGYLSASVVSADEFLSVDGTAGLFEYSALLSRANGLTDYMREVRAAGGVVGAWTIGAAPIASQLRRLGVGWLISDVPLDRSELGALPVAK